MAVIHVHYYTDPACPWSWAMEPTLRRLGDYATLRAAALTAGARPTASEPPSIEHAFARWGSLSTAEVAAVCRLPGPRAPAELWALATEWRLQAERVASGELWTPA
jgi:hypothetical protein